MVRSTVIWLVLGSAIVAALAGVATSPQLAWRHSIYIAAGFAGVVALVLLLVQPLLIGGYLGGIAPAQARRVHRWIGGLLVASVLVHVGGLWVTSAPDVIDALLFESPTPFSPYGVVAMWAVFVIGILAALRRRMRLRPELWRGLHLGLATIIAGCTMVHALLIEGTMETVSKIILCVLISVAVTAVLLRRQTGWRSSSKR